MLNRRSKAVLDSLSQLQDTIDSTINPSAEQNGVQIGTSIGFAVITGIISSAFSAIPGFGILACILQTAVGISISGAYGSDDGSDLMNGISEYVKNEISEYDYQELSSEMRGMMRLAREFHLDVKNNVLPIHLANSIDIMNALFIDQIELFRKYGKKSTKEIFSFTLFANSHLDFLSQSIRSAEKYGLSKSKTDSLYRQFKERKTDYINHIDSVYEYTTTSRLEVVYAEAIEDFNYNNDYYNKWGINVYDFSNYWFALDPVTYPDGILVENARITLSRFADTAYNGGDHWGGQHIIQYISSNNLYQYKGKLDTISIKYTNCLTDNLRVLDYLSNTVTSNFNIRKSTIINNIGNGVTGNLVDFKVNSLGESKVNVYKIIDSMKKDYLSVRVMGSILLGADPSTYFYRGVTPSVISYQNKVVAFAAGTSYNYCNFQCTYAPGSSSLSGVKVVEGVLFGFVNSDVQEYNIVMPKGSTMVDSMKYYYIGSDNIVYSRDSIKRYFGGMVMPCVSAPTINSIISYKIEYSPYEMVPKEFSIRINLKWVSSPSKTFKIKLSTTYDDSTTKSSSEVVFQKVISENNEDFIIGKVVLQPTIYNFIIIENIGQASFVFNHLIFTPTNLLG